MYLLISSFVIILYNYLLVMAESPQTDAFKAVQYTVMQLQIRFGLKTKSHLEATKLWWKIHGSINGFGDNLLRKSPITMATMASLQRINDISIVMTNVKLRVL